jgi:Tfp pilus assembly protein PilO
MEAKQLARIKELIRHPVFILGAVAALGLFVSAMIVSLRIAPLTFQSRALTSELQDLQFRLAALDKQPIPVKPAEADLQTLLQQIPKDGDYSGLLVSLREFEVETGARIVTVSFGEKKAKSDLESVIAAQSASTGAANTNNSNTGVPNGNSSTGVAASPNNSQAPALLATENVNIGLEGNSTQLNGFMSKLYEAKHLITIQDWSMTGGDEIPLVEGSETQAQPPKLKLDINMQIYKAGNDFKPRP